MITQSVILGTYEGPKPGERTSGFHQMVAEYSRVDPMPTLRRLSQSQKIPLGAIVRYVLVHFCASGSEALLEMGPRVVREMAKAIEKAEAAGTDEARLAAYRKLANIVNWLDVPLTDPGWQPADQPHRRPEACGSGPDSSDRD